VDGWSELLEVAGTMHLARVLSPAIHLAREGYAVTPVVAREWASAFQLGLLASTSIREAWAPAGRAPRAGERFSQPDLAHTLQHIAEGGRDAFYSGPIAERIVAFSEAEGAGSPGGLRPTDRVGGAHRSSTAASRVQLPPNGRESPPDRAGNHGRRGR
jgi:gamma-glutamyltranspeptidase/glutathione hydrolase